MKYQVPLDADGNVVRYPRNSEVAAWRENLPFEAVVRIASYPKFVNEKTWLQLETEDGIAYPMLAVELARAIYSGVNFKDNWGRAVWDIRKAGTAYSLRFVKKA